MYFCRTVISALWFLPFSAGAVSTVSKPPFSESFELQFGGTVSVIDSSIRIDKKGDLGAEVDLEDDFKFDESVKVGRIDGHWRFKPSHRIRFSYIPLSRTANTQINKDFEFEGDIIKAGATIDSRFTTNIYDVDYMYSVFKSANAELGVSAGLHWISIDLELEANGFIDIDDDDQSLIFDEHYQSSESVEAPLPLIGLSLNQALTSKWFVRSAMRYLDLSVDGYDGRLVSLGIGSDYYFTNNIGVGGAFSTFSMRIDADDHDTQGKFEWRYSGFKLYTTFKY